MTFDPNAFMNSAVEPMATTFELPPEGDCRFIIDSDPKQLTPREVKWNDKDTGEPRSFHQLELNCIAQDDRVKQAVGRDQVKVRMRINLDLNAAGGLDTGKNKNVALGALRDALGQNTPGWTPQKLLGAGPFMGKITHTADRKDPMKKYAEVTRATRIS